VRPALTSRESSRAAAMRIDCYRDATGEWPRKPFSALAEVNPRYSGEKGREYPFVEMASVGENFAGIRRFERRRLEGTGLSRFRSGDTLFAKITPCPENGKIAFVRGVPGDLGLGSTEFIVLSPRSGADPRFLFHALCSDAVRGRAAACMEGSTGRQRVPEEVFVRRLLIPCPPANEQAAIARILDAVDDALERNCVATECARSLERAVLEDAFNRLHCPTRRLGDFALDVKYGTSRPSSARGWGNPVLRIPNVIGDRLSLDDLAYVELPPSELESLQLQEQDLLLVRTNGNPGYVGRSAVFRRPDDGVWVYASYLIRVRLRNALTSQFVNVFLGLARGRREVLRRVTTSAGNHNINSNSIRMLQLPVPESADEQAGVVALAEACRRNVDALRARTHALEVLKKSLLHDLLTGRVRVPALPEATAP
jgi:type I restriction enzyme S subunit